MNIFSRKGGAHDAAKKKETAAESFDHRMETLSGNTPDRAKKPSKKAKTRTLTVLLIVLACLLAVVLLALLAYTIWSEAPETGDSGLKTQTTATPEASAAPPSPAGATAVPSATPTASPSPTPKEESAARKDDVYTLLIVGRDRVGLNTDTIMVARLDCENHRVNIVSIPRDTLVNVPWAVKKVNSVYGSAGIDGLVSEIEDLVGFGIDSYAVVNTYVFQQIIDCIGGVYFNVPIYMYYDDPDQDLHISLAPGYQLLNGYQCEQVVRFRQNNDGTGYPNGDLGRIETQHAFFDALATQVLQLGNISNLPQIISLIIDNTDTNLSSGNIAFYAQEFLKMRSDSISFYTIPYDTVYIRGGSYVSIQLEPWLDMINTYLNPFNVDVTAANLDVLCYDGQSFTSTTGNIPDFYSFYDYLAG